MVIIGIRELKARLSYYLQLTQKGIRIVVTTHGNPIAVLHKISQTEISASVEEKLAAAAAEGIIRLPLSLSSLNLSLKPVYMKGRLASETLLEDRR